MTKNLQKDNVTQENESHCGKKAIYSALAGGVAVLVICMGLCLSFDLHQTKIISSEILPQMQADYEAQIAELNAEIELLQREFNKLKSEHLSLDTLSEEYINTKLLEFEQSLQTQAKVYETEQNIEPEILLSAGAMILRSMAENGEDFNYEAEVLQIIAQGNPIAEKYIAEIRKISTHPLSNKAALISEFKHIYAELNGTEITTAPSAPKIENADSPASWKDAFIRRLKSLVTFKDKKTVKFDLAPDTVYDLVESGNLALALKKINTDNKYTALNSPILEAWKAEVQQYLDFNNAINGIIMNALAHIHLKQLEK